MAAARPHGSTKFERRSPNRRQGSWRALCQRLGRMVSTQERRSLPRVNANSLGCPVSTVLDLDVGSANLHFWDLGGEASLRRLWSRYYTDADVLVYAMDSRDWVGIVAAHVTSSNADDGLGDEGDDVSPETRRKRREESWGTLGERNRGRSFAYIADDQILFQSTWPLSDSSHPCLYFYCSHTVTKSRTRERLRCDKRCRA